MSRRCWAQVTSAAMREKSLVDLCRSASYARYWLLPVTDEVLTRTQVGELSGDGVAGRHRRVVVQVTLEVTAHDVWLIS